MRARIKPRRQRLRVDAIAYSCSRSWARPTGAGTGIVHFGCRVAYSEPGITSPAGGGRISRVPPQPAPRGRACPSPRTYAPAVPPGLRASRLSRAPRRRARAPMAPDRTTRAPAPAPLPAIPSCPVPRTRCARSPRGKGRVYGSGREPARERAHLLADVAAEDPVADQGPQLTGDGASLLDGQVRDAAACIHDRCTGNVASEQRARGTCVYTGAACTAMVAGERLVVVELELDEQCAEEHVRPVPGLQQHRVAPLPAERSEEHTSELQ